MANIKGIAVKILGKDYQVSCPEDQTHHLIEAALLLDSKMKDIKSTGKVIGLERIAVMAALNLAYDLQAQKHSADQSTNTVNQQLLIMCEKLEAALNPTAV